VQFFVRHDIGGGYLRSRVSHPATFEISSAGYVSTTRIYTVAAAPRGLPEVSCDSTTATIPSPYTIPWRMLRLRPRATSALQKAAGFGGASYIGLSLSSAPIRIEGRSNATMAQDGNNSDEAREKAQEQRAIFARQRAKEDGQETGRIAKWFPLSASEGFSQWWAGA
jgi:hypothetical protein